MMYPPLCVPWRGGENFLKIPALQLAYIVLYVVNYKCKEDTGRETP